MLVSGYYMKLPDRKQIEAAVNFQVNEKAGQKKWHL